jgi:hypothetical protein
MRCDENVWRFPHQKTLEDSLISRYIGGLEAMGYSLSSATTKVVVVIPRRFNFPLFVLFPLWTAGWLTAVAKTLRGVQPQSSLTIILICLLTVPVAYAWLWNLGGKEELEFTASVLTHRRRLFGVSRSRVFRMKRIDRPHFENSQSRGKSRTPSGIGFSYEGKQLRFGDHLTHRDAKEIVAAVLRQLPELRECWGSYAEGLHELDEDMTLNLNRTRAKEKQAVRMSPSPD